METDVLPRARMATDSALAGYASGKGSLVAVIESARALWGLQAELVMLESSIGDAWARLDRAIGTVQGTRR
jgi:outer membrane protein TolC